MGSLLKIAKSALNSIKEKGLGNFARELKQEGFLRCLPDGNLLVRGKALNMETEYCWLPRIRLQGQTKIHNIGSKLVGVDKFGNKYYEKLDGIQYGRHRWVEYGEKTRYNASQVPPEWHGWLHYITDHTGDELLMLKPQRYGIDHKQNFSGEGDEYIYHSKGHALNPGQKDWTRYQKWKPSESTQ